MSSTSSKQHPLIVILGPTGSGKTALSLAVAAQVQAGAEIISCDSVAVYRGFEIGTAKPSREERARVPHHMIDVATPDQPLTAGDYARMARTALDEARQRGRVPIVVGGTGLYLRALLDGLFAGPPRSAELRERLRASASQHGPGHLHQMLAHLDLESAARIHANDEAKLIRALEVCLTAGEPMSRMFEKGRDALTGFNILRIGLDPPRTALYERLNQRCEHMFRAGLVEETKSLLERYGASDVPSHPLQSLGYRQAAQYLRGELTLDEAIAAAQQGHRNYAKRQLTWFRREPEVRWLKGFGDEPAVQAEAESLVKGFLKDSAANFIRN